MIKKLLSAALLTCALASQAQQVQNPGFESWTSGNPDNWGSFSQMLVGLGLPNPGLETQTTTKNSGTYAVLLETKNVVALGQVIPGVVNTGPITYDLTNNKVVIGYQAYASQPASFSFYAMYTPSGTDTAFGQAIFTKWNTGTGQRDTLAFGGVLLNAMASYSQVTVPITWLISAVPDSIQMTFSSSTSGTPPAGSQLFVDDVNMVLTTGVQSMNANGTFTNVYPNPAVNYITFATFDEKAKYAQVYDLTGRNVAMVELTGKVTKTDISSFESGMYIYVITDAQGNKLNTAKFNVAK